MLTLHFLWRASTLLENGCACSQYQYYMPYKCHCQHPHVQHSLTPCIIVCSQPQAHCAWWRWRKGGEKEWGKGTIRKEIREGLWEQRSREGEEEAGGWLSSWRQTRFQLLLNRPNVFFSLSVSGTLFQRVGTSLHCNIICIYASYSK